MAITIIPMTIEYAKYIVKWQYPAPYNLYNMNDDAESIAELMAESYYAVLDSNLKLMGFYCYGNSAIVPTGNDFGAYDDSTFLDIGLGLKPDLCGVGRGKDFFNEALLFAKTQFNAYKLRLTVASFNQRAIKLYESFGFKPLIIFNRFSEHDQTEFVTLTYTPTKL